MGIWRDFFMVKHWKWWGPHPQRVSSYRRGAHGALARQGWEEFSPVAGDMKLVRWQPQNSTFMGAGIRF